MSSIIAKSCPESPVDPSSARISSGSSRGLVVELAHAQGVGQPAGGIDRQHEGARASPRGLQRDRGGDGGLAHAARAHADQHAHLLDQKRSESWSALMRDRCSEPLADCRSAEPSAGRHRPSAARARPRPAARGPSGCAEAALAGRVGRRPASCGPLGDHRDVGSIELVARGQVGGAARPSPMAWAGRRDPGRRAVAREPLVQVFAALGKGGRATAFTTTRSTAMPMSRCIRATSSAALLGGQLLGQADGQQQRSPVVADQALDHAGVAAQRARPERPSAPPAARRGRSHHGPVAGASTTIRS